MRYHLILAIFIILASCSNHQIENSKKIEPADKKSLTRRAWEMRRDGEPMDTIIKLQEKAVEQLRNGESRDNPVEVLEQMGFFYNIGGDLSAALKYYKEAADSLKTQPLSKRNDGAIQLFGDLSSLYAFLGMYEQALEYSDSALAESKRQKGIMLSDVYRFRAGIYELENKVQKASECYRLALAAVNNGAARTPPDVLRALILGEKAHLIINAYPDNRDSVAWAVTTLEETLKYDEFDQADRIYALGLGYLKQGKIEKGIKLLQESSEQYRHQEDIERINVANTALLETYAKYKMYNELAALVPVYIEDADSLSRQEQSTALIGAMIKYDLKSTEDRNKILHLQLEVEREKKVIVYGISIALILALTGCAIIFWQRNRLLNQKSSLQEKKLENLNESNHLLNERVGILEKDLSAGMNSNSSILSDPQLITGQVEGRFRRAFSVLFPNFIPMLKQDYSKLTKSDELLCMLLYLRHTTDEIAVYLGISKASVNSARYRLRTKFALPKDVELDTFIAERKY